MKIIKKEVPQEKNDTLFKADEVKKVYYYAITHRRTLKPSDAIGPFSTYEEAKSKLNLYDNDDCDDDVLLYENHKWYRYRKTRRGILKWEINKDGLPISEKELI